MERTPELLLVLLSLKAFRSGTDPAFEGLGCFSKLESLFKKTIQDDKYQVRYRTLGGTPAKEDSEASLTWPLSHGRCPKLLGLSSHASMLSCMMSGRTHLSHLLVVILFRPRELVQVTP